MESENKKKINWFYGSKMWPIENKLSSIDPISLTFSNGTKNLYIFSLVLASHLSIWAFFFLLFTSKHFASTGCASFSHCSWRNPTSWVETAPKRVSKSSHAQNATKLQLLSRNYIIRITLCQKVKVISFILFSFSSFFSIIFIHFFMVLWSERKICFFDIFSPLSSLSFFR